MDYLILTLATYRLSSLLATESGPLSLLVRFRLLVGVATDEHGSPFGTNNFATGLICVWCSSIWIGAALVVIYYLWTGVIWLCLPLALSTGTIMIDRYVR